MKKIISVVVVLLVVFAMAGCGEEKGAVVVSQMPPVAMEPTEPLPLPEIPKIAEIAEKIVLTDVYDVGEFSEIEKSEMKPVYVPPVIDHQISEDALRAGWPDVKRVDVDVDLYDYLDGNTFDLIGCAEDIGFFLDANLTYNLGDGLFLYFAHHYDGHETIGVKHHFVTTGINTDPGAPHTIPTITYSRELPDEDYWGTWAYTWDLFDPEQGQIYTVAGVDGSEISFGQIRIMVHLMTVAVEYPYADPFEGLASEHSSLIRIKSMDTIRNAKDLGLIEQENDEVVLSEADSYDVVEFGPVGTEPRHLRTMVAQAEGFAPVTARADFFVPELPDVLREFFDEEGLSCIMMRARVEYDEVNLRNAGLDVVEAVSFVVYRDDMTGYVEFNEFSGEIYPGFGKYGNLQNERWYVAWTYMLPESSNTVYQRHDGEEFLGSDVDALDNFRHDYYNLSFRAFSEMRDFMEE